MKLIIFDNGDPSNGISETQYEIDVPFNKDDVEYGTLSFFKDSIHNIYKEFAEGRLILLYDFEIA